MNEGLLELKHEEIALHEDCGREIHNGIPGTVFDWNWNQNQCHNCGTINGNWIDCHCEECGGEVCVDRRRGNMTIPTAG
jgi:hypothetical protein